MGTLNFIGGSELILVLFVVLLLFGSKQIPEFARMLGKGMHEFKKATEDIKREINKEAKNLEDDINDATKSLKS